MKKTIKVLCFIAIDKPNFLQLALGNTFEHDTWTAVQTVMDTWGKRCSQMIMFGDVPSVKVDSVPFLAVQADAGSSWKALAHILTQVMLLQ